MNASGRIKIGVISAGKVGCALASAWRAAGHQIIGAYARSDASLERLETMLPQVPALDIPQIVAAADLVLLAVPDDELAPLVAGVAQLGLWRAGQIVLHTAGRYGLSVLRPAQAAGALCLAIHPAMTFTGTSLDISRLQGAPFAITAPAIYQAIAEALVLEIGGTSVVIAEENREAYHLALAHGANHLVTLIAQSMRILAAIGIASPGQYLAPLTTAALEGALSSADTLLTGPIVRGDFGSVAAHLDALEELAQTDTSFADLDATYRAMALATAQQAHRRKKLNATQVADFAQLLANRAQPTDFLPDTQAENAS